MIIDTHPHLLADDPDNYPIAPYEGEQAGWSKGIRVTAEDYLALQDKAGIDKAAIVQPSGIYGVDNSYCVDSARRYPGRFVSVVTLDMLAPDAADTLSYWVEERGARGLRLFTTGTGYAETTWLDDPATFPVWERARKYGLPVVVMIRPTGIPRLRHVIDQFPDIPVLLDHTGNPSLEDGPPYAAAQSLFDLAAYPNLYIKVTSLTFQLAQKGKATVATFLRQLVDQFGAQRIMWGSNFPATVSDRPSGGFQGLVDLAHECLSTLTEEERRWIWGETALRVYPTLRD